MDNIAADNLELSNEEFLELDKISALTPEYPGWMMTQQGQQRWPS